MTVSEFLRAVTVLCTVLGALFLLGVCLLTVIYSCLIVAGRRRRARQPSRDRAGRRVRAPLLVLRLRTWRKRRKQSPDLADRLGVPLTPGERDVWDRYARGETR